MNLRGQSPQVVDTNAQTVYPPAIVSRSLPTGQIEQTGEAMHRTSTPAAILGILLLLAAYGVAFHLAG